MPLPINQSPGRDVPIPNAEAMAIAGRTRNPGWVVLTTPAYVDGTGATVPPPLLFEAVAR